MFSLILMCSIAPSTFEEVQPRFEVVNIDCYLVGILGVRDNETGFRLQEPEFFWGAGADGWAAAQKEVDRLNEKEPPQRREVLRRLPPVRPAARSLED